MANNALRAIGVLTKPEAEAAVLASLGMKDGRRRSSFNWRAIAAESIRASLWALSSGGARPVYTTRITNLASELLGKGDLFGFSWVAETQDSAEATSLTGVLDELEALGDIASVPGGYHLPAPLRAVPLDEAISLVVGGIPTVRMNESANVRHEGVGRLISSDKLPDSLPLEPLDEWTRTPEGRIDAWAEEVVQKSVLSPLSDQVKRDLFEYYCPSIGNRARYLQAQRWTDQSAALRNGRYLVRYRLVTQQVHFAIGLVEEKELVATGPASAGSGGIRRLLYGLDLLAGRPTAVQVVDEGTVWQFVVRNPLPNAERRLVAAIGKLEPRADGHLYPQTWTTSADSAQAVVERLQQLGVEIR